MFFDAASAVSLESEDKGFPAASLVSAYVYLLNTTARRVCFGERSCRESVKSRICNILYELTLQIGINDCMVIRQ